jgi:hypothetical protein
MRKSLLHGIAAVALFVAAAFNYASGTRTVIVVGEILAGLLMAILAIRHRLRN